MSLQGQKAMELLPACVSFSLLYGGGSALNPLGVVTGLKQWGKGAQHGSDNTLPQRKPLGVIKGDFSATC